MTDSSMPEYVVEDVPVTWLMEHEQEIAPLLALQQEPTPFQGVPWLMSWWRTYGQDYESHVLVIRRGDATAGVMPLMARRGKTMPVLEWLGAGRSDHAPALFLPGKAGECMEAAVSFLRASPIEWSLISLRTLQETQTRSITEHLTPADYRLDQDDVSPRTVIHGGWNDYLAQKSRKHRGNIKRLFKQAQETPALVVSCVTEYSPGLLDEIIELERCSWKAQEGSLRLEGQGREFYREFLKNMADARQLELWCCRYDGMLLAYIITFNYRDAIFYYNGAYRSDYASFQADISPGSLLIAHAVKSAHDRGVKFFDFLRGDESYKKLWVNEDRRLHHLVVRASGLSGWAAEILLIRLRWWLRRYPAMHKLRGLFRR